MQLRKAVVFIAAHCRHLAWRGVGNANITWPIANAGTPMMMYQWTETQS